MRDKIVEAAIEVASAVEWSGDIRVNFLTCQRAARVLTRYIDELEKENRILKENSLTLDLDIEPQNDIRNL